MIETILAAFIGAAATIAAALVAAWFRKRRQKARQARNTDDNVTSLSEKIDTLWRWAFGLPEDSTDEGVAGDISEGFENVSDDIERLEKQQQTFHEQEMKQFYRLVNALHDEENIDIERDDVLKNKEE